MPEPGYTISSHEPDSSGELKMVFNDNVGGNVPQKKLVYDKCFLGCIGSI